MMNSWILKHSNEFGEYVKQTLDRNIFCFESELINLFSKNHVFGITKHKEEYILVLLPNNDQTLSHLFSLNKSIMYNYNKKDLELDLLEWVYITNLTNNIHSSITKARSLLIKFNISELFIPELIKEYPNELAIEFEKWFESL